MGSITQALRTAQSGLLVNQRVMDTIAQNVTNVNTEGIRERSLDSKTKPWQAQVLASKFLQ